MMRVRSAEGGGGFAAGLVAASLAALLSAGCSAGDTGDGSTATGAPPPPQENRVVEYECGGGYLFSAAIGTEEAVLELPGRRVELRPVPAASGARYEGEGVLFWSQGEEAQLEVDGVDREACTSDQRRSVWRQARQRGIDFRGTGNEPGWYLEIEDGERITMVADYGERRVESAAPPPRRSEDGQRTVYEARTERGELKITIEQRSCADSMSGFELPATVTVELEGTTYNGCGRALDPGEGGTR